MCLSRNKSCSIKARSAKRGATEDEATHRLGDALGRLHTFAVLHGPGEVVDNVSGLTTEDLNLLLEALEKVHARLKVAHGA